jgi:hypothetical protein
MLRRSKLLKSPQVAKNKYRFFSRDHAIKTLKNIPQKERCSALSQNKDREIKIKPRIELIKRLRQMCSQIKVTEIKSAKNITRENVQFLFYAPML